VAEFPDCWDILPVEECTDRIIDYRGKTPKKASAGVPLITAKVVKNGRILQPQEYIPEEDFEAWMRRGIPEPGDVVITTEAPLGEVGQLDETQVALAQRLIALGGKDGLLDNAFLKFAMQSPFVQMQLRARSSGTTVLGIKQSELRKVQVQVPPMGEQKGIAQILGTLDDKIELNRKMNQALESIARTLFKSWFVDFDPVRAKMEGRQPLGMDAETAELFPDSFEDSELGKIPKGWGISKVGVNFNVTMGQSPPGETYNELEDGILFFQGIRDFGSRFPSPRVFCTAPSRFAKRGDTLVSVRAPVGEINMALEDCCIGRGLSAVRHKEGFGSFTYYAMNNLHDDFSRFEAEGTVFGSMSKQKFLDVVSVVPPQSLIQRFDEVVASIDQRVETSHRESLVLVDIREALLPRLISGEIRVKDAEKVMEGLDELS
jgi:type I restriction enzyme S subunit